MEHATSELEASDADLDGTLKEGMVFMLSAIPRGRARKLWVISRLTTLQNHSRLEEHAITQEKACLLGLHN
jgi:hypothetical protein